MGTIVEVQTDVAQFESYMEGTNVDVRISGMVFHSYQDTPRSIFSKGVPVIIKPIFSINI